MSSRRFPPVSLQVLVAEVRPHYRARCRSPRSGRLARVSLALPEVSDGHDHSSNLDATWRLRRSRWTDGLDAPGWRGSRPWGSSGVSHLDATSVAEQGGLE